MRFGFDSAALSCVVHEAQEFVGGRVQRILGLDESTILLRLFRGREARLLLSADAQTFRAHFCAQKPASRETTDFIQRLRRSAGDGRIAFIRQRGLDRILEIGIDGPDGAVQLVGEFMGRHSNLILVDEQARCIAALKWVGPKQSRRPILPNRPYEPPPFPPRPEILDCDDPARLREFEGWSPGLQGLIEAGASWDELRRRWRENDWDPCLHDQFGPSPFPVQGASPRATWSMAAEPWFARKAQDDALLRAKTGLRSQLQRVLLAREAALDDLHAAADAADRAGETQREGELILAYQAMVAAGADRLDCWDYEGEPVSISLDPELTPAENAQRRFDKARRAKDRHDEVRLQAGRLTEDRTLLLRALQDLDAAESAEAVAPIRDLAEGRRWLHKTSAPKPKEERPSQGHPIRELITPGGWRLLYGTTATSNDHLTTKVARPSDWWLHVRGGPGAHVVLQTDNKPDRVQPADLRFAAEIAVRNSVAKHSGYVTVDVTLKRYVRKPRKSAPGFATYTHEKTIIVEGGKAG